MEAEVHQLHQYIDIVKYCRDFAEGGICQLRQRSARLAKVRTVHTFSYPALLPKLDCKHIELMA